MAKSSKTLVVVIVVVILAIAALAVLQRGRLRCAGFAGPSVTEAELPPPAMPGRLRFASWNVRNFPLDERPEETDLGYSRRTNICDLELALGGLDADLLALQEVCDTRRFPPILRRAAAPRTMAVRFSHGGGRFGQHLALAWDQDVLQLVGEPVEITDLALDAGMRPGLAAVFRSSADPSLDFTVVTLHLQSGRQGFADRRRQNRALVEWVRAWLVAGGDQDLVVLGDFNSAGSPRGGAAGELQSMAAILGRAGLVRVENATGCTQYWEGPGDRDGVQVPSQLDHIFLTGSLVSRLVGPAESWLHCARLGCRDLVSRVGEEDGTFWDVSDHCPVTIELATAG